MKTLYLALILLMCANFAYGDEISDLIPYIIEVESGGDSNAVSEDNCRGLMQIGKSALAEYNYYVYKGPIYGFICVNELDGHVYGCVHQDWTGIKTKEYKLEDLFIPDINIEVGEWYLRRLRDYYLKDQYTIERCLASYNGGITRMLKLLKQGKDWQDMPKESVSYVKKILKLKAKCEAQ